MRVKLRDIAHARAGDKGDISNVSLIVFDLAHYERVRLQVSPERVKVWFGPLVQVDVVRYELPQLGAFNLCHARGVGRRRDPVAGAGPHGKSRSSLLLEMEIELEEAGTPPAVRDHAPLVTPGTEHTFGGAHSRELLLSPGVAGGCCATVRTLWECNHADTAIFAVRTFF